MKEKVVGEVVRKTVMFPKELAIKINQWRARCYEERNYIPSFSKAVVELVERGLKDEA